MHTTQPHRLYPNASASLSTGATATLNTGASFTLSIGLGNVRTTITDRKLATFDSNWLITGYTADIKSANDYFPFGSEMPGRSYNSGEYRFGFNGMEKDDEVKGQGNSLDFGARIYDSRIGRWLSLDPMAEKYPYLSPYLFADNNPIIYVDPDGKEPRWGQLANLNEIMGEVKLALTNFKELEYKWYYNLFKGLTDRQINASKQFSILKDHFEHNTRYDRDHGELVAANGNRDRYMYTTKSGWIDMHHFFYFAEKGALLQQNPLDVAAESFGSELIQSIKGNPSGYSYEDLVSNKLGYRFGLDFGSGKYGDLSIKEAITKFMENLGATEPENAPNFEFIPHIANDNVPRSFSNAPLIGEELREAHRNVHENRPEDERSNIKEAQGKFRR